MFLGCLNLHEGNPKHLEQWKYVSSEYLVFLSDYYEGYNGKWKEGKEIQELFIRKLENACKGILWLYLRGGQSIFKTFFLLLLFSY